MDSSKSDSNAMEECRRMGKSNYILKKLRRDIVNELKDVDYIARQLNNRGILNEKETQNVTSQREGSTLTPEETLLDILYTKKQDEVDSFRNLLRETNHYNLVAKIEEYDRELDILLQNTEVPENTQYTLPATVPSLPKGQPESIIVNQFKADVVATTDGIVQLIKRSVWGASSSIGKLTDLKHPVEFVIFSHTASIGSYMTTLECVQACKQAQDLNMSWGWSDIAYNFLVGNDGAIYEGRGWNYEGSTALGWNKISLGIAFIGKYVDRMPSLDALDAVKSFLQYMVDSKILKKDFTIHCLRQVREQFPDAPGDMLYAKIQTWRGKGQNKWSWRELEAVEETDIVYPEEQKLPASVREKLIEESQNIVAKVALPKDILDLLVKKQVFTRMKQQMILKNNITDVEISQQLFQNIVCGKSEWFTFFLDALLETNQRMLAKALWKIIPYKERKLLKRPLLRVGEEPMFRDIPLSQISFDTCYDTNGMKSFELGAGSFGVVVLASYTLLGGAKVAVKKVKGSEHGGMNEKDIRDFKKEAKTMYTLRHPDIVSIYGTICDTQEHVYGIVMEYMEIGSLDDLMSKLEIPWPLKVRMLRDVCRGLTFLNTPQPDRKYTVTHCDIKSKNILLNDRFSAKIADFGEAVLQNIATRSTGSKSLASDRNHGTVTHMAPDLLIPLDDDYDPNEKTDVWSFGITIFEVCAENAKGTSERRTPFAKKMKLAQITSMIGIMKKSPFNKHEMEKIPQDCPKFLTDLMQHCSKIDKAERFTFKEVLAVLEENYQKEFEMSIHMALIQLHKMYQENVLNLGHSHPEDELESTSDDFSILQYPASHDCYDEIDGLANKEASTVGGNKEKCKSRKKELDILTKQIASLEKRVTMQMVDIDSLHTSVNDVSKAKEALEQELKLVKETSEQMLIAPLEKRIGEIEITVKHKIDEAKEEIIHMNKDTGRKMELELDQLGHRLTKQISMLSDHSNSGSIGSNIMDSSIKQHFMKLVEDIDPKEIIDYLRQELFSRDEYEQTMAQITTTDKNRMLLHIVDQKDQGIKILHEALAQKECMIHLCKYLNVSYDTQ